MKNVSIFFYARDEIIYFLSSEIFIENKMSLTRWVNS